MTRRKSPLRPRGAHRVLPYWEPGAVARGASARGCFTMMGDRWTSTFAVECLPIIEKLSRILALCSQKQRQAKVKIFVSKGVFFPFKKYTAETYEYKQYKQQGKENKPGELQGQALSRNKGKEARSMKRDEAVVPVDVENCQAVICHNRHWKSSNEKAWEALQLLCLGSSHRLHILESSVPITCFLNSITHHRVSELFLTRKLGNRLICLLHYQFCYIKKIKSKTTPPQNTTFMISNGFTFSS